MVVATAIANVAVFCVCLCYCRQLNNDKMSRVSANTMFHLDFSLPLLIASMLHFTFTHFHICSFIHVKFVHFVRFLSPAPFCLIIIHCAFARKIWVLDRLEIMFVCVWKGAQQTFLLSYVLLYKLKFWRWKLSLGSL